MTPTIVAGRYRVDRAVGQGGMGTVWLCTDEVLGRRVAVKQVGHLPGESSTDAARALREARSSAALNHRNVVAVYDAIEDGDHIWLVMEYVPGRSLSEILEEEGRLEPQRAARIGAQVADGLAAAHLRGTTHRDVKPGNILVGDHDLAKISDFGIARTVGDSQLTQTGMVTGTPGYFSPQLARGEEPSPADDVWALGATLFAATEGRPPYPTAGNALAQLSAIATSDPPPPTRAGPLSDAIRAMMAVDRAQRWSMAFVAEHLHQVAAGEPATGTHERVAPVPAPVEDKAGADHAPTTVEEAVAEPAPVPVPEPVPPETASRRRWPLVLAVVALAAVVALVAWAVLADDPEEGGPSASGEQSRSASTPSDGTQESDDAPTDEPAPTQPTEGDASPDETAGSAEQFVADYYALLPSDTGAAWALLSPEMQEEVGSIGDYEAFWTTVESVEVDETTSTARNVVEVTLTYVTSDGSEQETRRIEVAEQAGGFLIADDEVVA